MRREVENIRREVDSRRRGVGSRRREVGSRRSCRCGGSDDDFKNRINFRPSTNLQWFELALWFKDFIEI